MIMNIEELIQEIKRIKSIDLFDERIKEALIIKNIQKYAFHNMLTIDQAIENLYKHISNGN